MAKSNFSPCSDANQRQLQSYLWWFHIFGQNTCIPIQSKFRTSYIPQIIAFAIFVLGIVVFTYELDKYSDIPSKNKVIWYLLWAVVVVDFYAIGQSFRMPSDTRYMMHSFALITNQMNQRLNTSICSGVLIKRFTVKVKIIVVSQFVLFTIIFQSSHLTHGFYVEFFHALLVIYRIASTAHIMFYTDFITFLMHSMKERLENVWLEYTVQRSSTEYIHRSTNILKHVKYFHYKLQSCQRVVNQCFGWIVVMIITETFLSATRSGYWAFHFIVSAEFSLVLFIRKYTLLLSICHA